MFTMDTDRPKWLRHPKMQCGFCVALWKVAAILVRTTCEKVKRFHSDFLANRLDFFLHYEMFFPVFMTYFAIVLY